MMLKRSAAVIAATATLAGGGGVAYACTDGGPGGSAPTGTPTTGITGMTGATGMTAATGAVSAVGTPSGRPPAGDGSPAVRAQSSAAATDGSARLSPIAPTRGGELTAAVSAVATP